MIDARNSCGVTRRFRPTPICAPGSAERMYHASLLPFGIPIARANVSSGWTWIDNGALVNSNLRSKAGIGALLVGALEPELSHRIPGTVDAAPWLEIADAPGLVHGPHGGVFDGHRIS